MSDSVQGKSRRTCVRLDVSDKLTIGSDLATAAAIAATYEGQAHFARTGPAGATCRECSFWCRPAGSKGGAYARSEGFLKPRRCRKFRQISGGATGKGIPHDAGACKYFEAAERAPKPFTKPRKPRAE